MAIRLCDDPSESSEQVAQGRLNLRHEDVNGFYSIASKPGGQAFADERQALRREAGRPRQPLEHGLEVSAVLRLDPLPCQVEPRPLLRKDLSGGVDDAT